MEPLFLYCEFIDKLYAIYEQSILIVVNSNIKYQYNVILIFSESTLYVCRMMFSYTKTWKKLKLTH